MQKLRPVLFIISFLFIGCAQLENWRSNNTLTREFQVKTSWVKQTTEKDNLGFRKINRMQPLIYNNLVIQSNGLDGITAFDKFNGQIRWKTSIKNGSEAGAAIINDRLFLGGSDGLFYSLNANTGEVIWTFPTQLEIISEPLVDSGVVYFLTGNNSMYALDAATGKQVWLYTRQDSSNISIRGGAKPTLRNGTLYVGFSDGFLVALLSQNGAIKWEKQLNKNKKFKDLDSNPIIENEYLYVMGFDDKVYCLRAATGDQVWKFDQGGYGQGFIVGDRYYFASTEEKFVALNKMTGEVIWTVAIKEGIATSAAAYKGMIIFGESQGKLNFVDSTNGKIMKTYDPGRGLMSQPVVDEKNNRLYFISNEANLYSLEIGWNYIKRIPYLN